MRSRLLAIGYWLLAAAVPLAGQQPARLQRTHAVELTFAGGYSLPTGAAGDAGGLTLTRKGQWEAGVHFGAYARSGHWGAELSAGYTPERVRQTTGAGAAGSRRTHLTFGTAKLLFGKSPRQAGVSFMAGAGLGVMHRQMSVLDSDVGSTNAAGVASAMIRIPIDDQVGLRLDAEDLITKLDFGTGKKLRNDFMLTAGLGISW
jgi:hypothetical protein